MKSMLKWNLISLGALALLFTLIIGCGGDDQTGDETIIPDQTEIGGTEIGGTESPFPAGGENGESCLPSCIGKLCGDDGCGGDCGTCLAGEVCNILGTCEAQPLECNPVCAANEECQNGICICLPNCVGKNCGDDGCGNSCGPDCTNGNVCSPAGVCEAPACVPNCTNADNTAKLCGDDGCGGTCGQCGEGLSCTDAGQCESTSCVGKCDSEYITGAPCQCDAGCMQFDDCCDDYCDACPLADGCCDTTCGDAKCGDDGCGGTCGECADGEACSEGQCACAPQCEGKTCGDDGCGGVCGECAPGSTCNNDNCSEDLTLGASCWNTDQSCPAGSECVMTATFTDAKCYSDQNTGSPCGPGFGLCVSGANCMLNNAQSSFECFADQGLGSVCGSGIGDCGENASCQWEDYNYNQTVCIANEATGADCGAPGKGGCDAGNACVYVNPGSVILQCFEDQSAEDVCGYGIGLCESGSDCVFNAEGSDNATCQPQADAGDICGGYGQPNCGPFMGCLPENAEATSGICTTLSLAGDACGTPEGVCVGGTSCVYTDGTQTNAVCAVNGLIGATCGYGTVGWCWAGLTCAVEDAADVIGVCQDACELDGLYNNGTCDEGCWTLDPDCI